MGTMQQPVQPYLIEPQMEKLLQGYAQSIEHIIPRLAQFHLYKLFTHALYTRFHTQHMDGDVIASIIFFISLYFCANFNYNISIKGSEYHEPNRAAGPSAGKL